MGNLPKVVADEGLDMAIVVDVAGDEDLEVGSFVEEGGEEFVGVVGKGIGGMNFKE